MSIPPLFPVNKHIVYWIVALDFFVGARAPSLEVHHLWLAPKKLVLGTHLLGLHLLLNVIVGNDTMVTFGVGISHDPSYYLLCEAVVLDGVLQRERHAILGRITLVVTFAEHAVDVKNHVGVVLIALAVVCDGKFLGGVIENANGLAAGGEAS